MKIKKRIIVKKDVSKAAQEGVSKVLKQAKESLKLLESAKSFVKIPGDRGAAANAKVLASFRKLGMATQEELNILRSRVEKLEAALATHVESLHAAEEQAEKAPIEETQA